MIGIYGGTFDPIHYGHLRTALELKEVFNLEQVRLMPCHQSPLKDKQGSSPQHRLQMLQLAIQGEAGLVCDTRELDKAGRSYTVNTLAQLRGELPDCPLLLFIGMDGLVQLKLWHQWQCLFDYAHVVVITRPSIKPPLLDEFLQQRLTVHQHQLHSKPAGKLYFQAVTQLDISATVIRELVQQGRSIRFLLPDPVIDYIRQHQLYRKLNAN